MFHSRLSLLLTATLLLSDAVQALWPLPRSLQTGHQTVLLAQDFKITVSREPSLDLWAAITKTEEYLKNDKLQRLVVGRGASDAPTFETASKLHTLTLSLGENSNNISTEAKLPLGTRDEAYTLWIPADGSAARLSANSSLGLFRGLTTFSQLWYVYEESTYVLDCPIFIKDRPAFPYRGFMLDTARHYFPVDVIKRQLVSMSWVKINTFHWHIVDSQSFPLVVPGFENISKYGAYSFSDIYSPQDVEDVVSYAASIGIDVLIEIDTPGHTGAISYSYPEHIACARSRPSFLYAHAPPAGQLRIASASSTNFTAKLLSAIADMFPGQYISTGGDEINQLCYITDQPTREDLFRTGRTLDQALNVFTKTTHEALIAKGKTPVVWEEMALEHTLTLAKDTIVMVWRSSLNAAGVAAKGFRIIHSPSDYFYLDCGGGSSVGNCPNCVSWCPFTTWQKAYSFDPLAHLTIGQHHLVLGGQQVLWTELSSPNNVDSIVWPRAAVSAEVFWSGPGGDAKTALARLHDISYRMDRRGINTIPLQPFWCVLRPDECDLFA